MLESELEWAIEMVDSMLKELYADGYPVGTKPLDKATIRQNLIAMMQAGDPTYWQDPAAQAQLPAMSGRFGAPPLMQPPVMGGV